MPKAPAKKASKRLVSARPKTALLSGGNPQIAKGDGSAPVRAYLDGMPGWKRAVGEELDALIVASIPDVTKAVRWNSPFYGREGRGWYISFHCLTKYIKVAFFRGSSLRPTPPGTSKTGEVRYLDIFENDKLDRKQLSSWFRQAAKLPGWKP